jgi:hypothetical protein
MDSGMTTRAPTKVLYRPYRSYYHHPFPVPVDAVLNVSLLRRELLPWQPCCASAAGSH